MPEFHQQSRKGKTHKTKEAMTMTEIFGTEPRTEHVGYYRTTDAYIRDIENSWFDVLTERYIQIVLLSRCLDEAVEPVAVWETAPVMEGLSSYSDIGEPPVWYDWKLRWVKFPQLHLEGNRLE